MIDKQRQNVYHQRDAILEADADAEKKKIWLEQTKAQFLLNAQEVLAQQVQVAEATGQGVTDLLDVLIKEYGLQLSKEQKEQFSQLSYDALLEQLTVKLVTYFQNVFEKEDSDLVFEVFRDVHLRVIDKLWIPHIDEMQYLKDKVGFMGYAQMDPLVVYKKESFEKFQDLLANIKTDTTRMLMGIDYTRVAEFKQMQEQFLMAAKGDPELMKKLQEASKQGGKIVVTGQ